MKEFNLSKRVFPEVYREFQANHALANQCRTVLILVHSRWIHVYRHPILYQSLQRSLLPFAAHTNNQPWIRDLKQVQLLSLKQKLSTSHQKKLRKKLSPEWQKAGVSQVLLQTVLTKTWSILQKGCVTIATIGMVERDAPLNVLILIALIMQKVCARTATSTHTIRRSVGQRRSKQL